MEVSLRPPQSNPYYLVADPASRETLKFRKHLEKQIHNLKADSATGTDMAHFDAIEETMAM
jgi:hypothetical protein